MGQFVTRNTADTEAEAGVPEHSIAFQLDPELESDGLSFQRLDIILTRPDRLITPADLPTLSLPEGIDTQRGVVLSGRAPIWLYSYLVHELDPTAWVACYDPRLGAVVVATHSRQTKVGQVIPLSLSQGRSRFGMALMIVGPPDSGKSVLSHALFQSLLPNYPDSFLQRAQWDGEGNWILELPDDATDNDRETFKLAYKGGLTDQFYPHHADAILRLRREKPLVLVDVGGKVQSEKVPVLEACSHYLIISRDRQEVPKWHEFCGKRGNLRPLAVIHSTLERTATIHKHAPFLELTCGPWVQGQAIEVPQVLLEHITAQLPSG